MSNEYIPKERLTAYERWEVAAIDEAERMSQAMRDAETARPAPPLAPPDAEISAPPEPQISAEDLAAIREQAFAEGRAAGHEEGFAQGKQAGYDSGKSQVDQERSAIAALATSFSTALEASEAELADGLLTLALDVAAQVLRTSIKVQPKLILPAVREAIAALINTHGHPSITLHPDDAALVRDELGEQLGHTGWRILDDPKIERGGCKVENSGAEIDASLPTRWRRVIEHLGKNGDWLQTP